MVKREPDDRPRCSTCKRLVAEGEESCQRCVKSLEEYLSLANFILGNATQGRENDG